MTTPPLPLNDFLVVDLTAPGRRPCDSSRIGAPK